MKRDRVIALAIALLGSGLFYAVVIVHWHENPRRALSILFLPVLFLFPLGLIWFGDELGEYTGPVSRGYITQKSPGCLVKLLGWIFLVAITGVFLSLTMAGSLGAVGRRP